MTGQLKQDRNAHYHLWKKTRSLQYTPSVPSCFSPTRHV